MTPTKASSLDRIEELLLRGERHKASQFAMDEKLWAHAMVIASSIDKDAWKGVVNDFLKSEFPAASPRQTGHPAHGRETLRVAYSLFSGQGAAAGMSLLRGSRPQLMLHSPRIGSCFVTPARDSEYSPAPRSSIHPPNATLHDDAKTDTC